MAFDDAISHEYHHYSELETKFDAAIHEIDKLEAVTQELSDDLATHLHQDELTADFVHSLTQGNNPLESTKTQLELQVNSLTQRLS